MMEVHTDWDPTLRDLHVLENAPSARGVLAMSATLDLGLFVMKGATHVQTRSLQSSEKAEGDRKGSKWEGEISAGGVSTGVHNPVSYAIYEQARGESHDFLRITEVFLNPLWPKAVMEGFKR